jgi:hemerythrin-like metal-binding protein
MSRIPWSEQLGVGVPEIDRQHQKLLELFNALEDALGRGDAARMVRPLLAELVSYSKYHFSTEQNLMRLHRCPGTDEHVAAHDEFTAKIHRLEQVLEAEGGEAAALEISRFLRGWIVKHVIVADRLVWAAVRRSVPDVDPK